MLEVWNVRNGRILFFADISAPKKNIYPPPPKTLQFAAETLPALRPPPPGEPPGIFNQNRPPSPSRRLGLPLPLPRAEKIKNIRNVHQVFIFSTLGGLSRISGVSRRQWTFLKRPLFQETPPFRWRTPPSSHTQRARRGILMPRGKYCRETIFAAQLPRNYPHRGGNFGRGKIALSYGGEAIWEAF